MGFENTGVTRAGSLRISEEGRGETDEAFSHQRLAHGVPLTAESSHG